MRGPILSERISRSRSIRSESVRWGVGCCSVDACGRSFAQPEDCDQHVSLRSSLAPLPHANLLRKTDRSIRRNMPP